MSWVRARMPIGHEVTVQRTVAEAQGMTVLDKPAVDANGNPLPMKPKADLAPKPTTQEVSK